MAIRLSLVRFVSVLLVAVASHTLAFAALKVACVGDSITAGHALADPAHDAYPSQLARLLGDGYEVRNFGVSAATLMDAGNYTYRTRDSNLTNTDFNESIVFLRLIGKL